MRSLLFAVVLAGCAHEPTFGGGSHGVVSYASTSSTSTSSSSSSTSSAESTHVYHSNATGAPIASRSNAAAELNHSDGKAGGGLRDNQTLKAGLMTLTIGYASTVAIGQIIDATLIGDFENAVGAGGVIDRLWIPVLGPWSAIVYNETTVSDNCNDPTILAMYPGYSCNLLHPSSLFVLVGATAQTIGFGMTMYGLLKPPAPHAKAEKQFVLVPQGNATSAGFALSASF